MIIKQFIKKYKFTKEEAEMIYEFYKFLKTINSLIDNKNETTISKILSKYKYPEWIKIFILEIESCNVFIHPVISLITNNNKEEKNKVSTTYGFKQKLKFLFNYKRKLKTEKDVLIILSKLTLLLLMLYSFNTNLEIFLISRTVLSMGIKIIESEKKEQFLESFKSTENIDLLNYINDDNISDIKKLLFNQFKYSLNLLYQFKKNYSFETNWIIIYIFEYIVKLLDLENHIYLQKISTLSSKALSELVTFIKEVIPNYKFGEKSSSYDADELEEMLTGMHNFGLISDSFLKL